MVRTAVGEHRVDRVAAAGAIIALAAVLTLPFVRFRPNRVVTGEPFAVTSAGAIGWALAILCVLMVTLAMTMSATHRSPVLLFCAAVAFAVEVWSLGAAAGSLLATTTGPERVSVGAGAWGAFAGFAIVTFAAWRGTASRIARRSATLLGGIGVTAAAVLGGASHLSLVREYVVQSEVLWSAIGRHLFLVGGGLGFGALIGVPLGVAASRQRWIRDAAIGTAGIIQTIPSLAMLGLLFTPLAALASAYPVLRQYGVGGLGAAPAIVALTLYALLPIVRSTYLGISGVDPDMVDAGRGMGMNGPQLLLRVQVPLALPLIIEGLRVAAVLTIGIAAVTAFISAGGLGVLVFKGLGQLADDLTLLGALPMVVLAVLADVGFRWLSRALVSPGIRGLPESSAADISTAGDGSAPRGAAA